MNRPRHGFHRRLAVAAAAVAVIGAFWAYQAVRGWAEDFAALGELTRSPVQGPKFKVTPTGSPVQSPLSKVQGPTSEVASPESSVPVSPAPRFSGSVDLEEPSRRPPIPGTERYYRESFTTLARQNPESFLDRVRQSLQSPAPAPERVGALRAARDVLGAEGSFPLFVEALTRAPDPGDADSETVRIFAGDFLLRRTVPDAAVRAGLLRIAVEPSDVPADLRRRAARAAAAHAATDEVSALAAAVRATGDPELLAAAAAGLRANGGEEAGRAADEMDGGERGGEESAATEETVE